MNDNAPQDAAAARDRQLERALAAAVELVERCAIVKPPFDNRPRLARAKLPPRVSKRSKASK